MSLPTPTSSFTIPSLHDDLEVDCRIYYPPSSDKNAAFVGKSFAILAHPYAPLGGSYDDGVVTLIGSVLLRSGMLLGTFNFRGGGNSAGKTSWSGRAELGDYVAFYTFMLYFITMTETNLGRAGDGARGTVKKPLLILGGYSYGSMIASCLPPQSFMRDLLNQARQGCAEHEIKARAEQMARDYAAYMELRRQGSISRSRNSLRAADAGGSRGRATVLGGYESETASRRISRESSRKSFDGERVRQSLDRARQRLLHISASDRDVNIPTLSTPSSAPLDLLEPNLAYLLVSPLLPPVATLATLFTNPTFSRQSSNGQGVLRDGSAKEDKFIAHPACFIYGSRDVFTSSKKIKKWAAELHARASSTCSSCEVEGAGHFWREAGASQGLQSSLGDWLATLDRNRQLPPLPP